MKYQLLATDLDGTLLNDKKELTPGNREALNRALDAGKTIVFSSGRCLSEMRDLLPLFPKMRYAICLSGGCVYDLHVDRPLFEKKMDYGKMWELWHFCQEKDAMGMALSGKDLYLEDRFLGHLDQVYMDHYTRSYERYATWISDLRQVFTDAGIQIDKFNIYFRREADREECIELFKNAPLEIVRAEKTGIECNPTGISKGKAILELCRHLGIRPEETIVIGDSDNDLSMLKAAGLPIAVYGSTDVILAAAKEVVADCNHDAVAEAICRWML